MIKIKVPLFVEVIALFAVCLFIFTWGVGNQEIIGFESRFYLFALEMWRHGFTGFPLTYGKPYPDYPVTATLLIYLTGQMLGYMQKITAVIPSATAAALTVCLTFLIGNLRNKWWGWYGALFLLFTMTFVKLARSVSLDIYPMLITTCCFYLVYYVDQKDKRELLGWVYVLFLLGFAFRGPIGLIIPAAVVCSYHFLERSYRRMFFTAAFALLMLIVGMGILLGIAHSVGGHQFVDEVLWMQVVGRIDTHYLPYYYYFIESFGSYAITYPIAVLVMIGGLYYAWRMAIYSSDLKILFKLMVWVLVVMIGMSIPGDKKIRYILSIAPALALIAAYPFVASPGEKYFEKLRWLMSRLLLVVPVLFILGLNYLQSYAKSHSLDFPIDYSRLSSVLSFLLSISFLVFFRVKKQMQWMYVCVLSIATASFLWVYIYGIEPIEQHLDRTRQFVTQMESLRSQQHAKLVFYKEHPDGLPIKYLVNVPYDEHAQFIGTLEQLENYPYPAFFVTSESFFKDLPLQVAYRMHVVGHDNIGHVRVVVFTNR